MLKTVRNILLASGFFLVPLVGHTQTAYVDPAGCSAITLPTNTWQTWRMDSGGHLCISGSVSFGGANIAQETGGNLATIVSSLSTLNGKFTTTANGLKVDGSAVTQPVSGTFWQATQPVSGVFWQTTQPVSGTFWQATQPVSGTFWQSTQPISIADGQDITKGSKADAADTNPANTDTLVAFTKGLHTRLAALALQLPATLGQTTKSASLSVTLASDQGNLNTNTTPPDASGTVTTGATFQQVFAANSSRVSCLIQNPTSATEALYVFDASAGTPSYNNSWSLGPGASYSCAGNGTVNTNAIKVTAVTTAHVFVARGS